MKDAKKINIKAVSEVIVPGHEEVIFVSLFLSSDHMSQNSHSGGTPGSEGRDLGVQRDLGLVGNGARLPDNYDEELELKGGAVPQEEVLQQEGEGATCRERLLCIRF